MSDEERILSLEKQVTDLRVEQAATAQIVAGALEKIGNNAQSLEAVHRRLDEQRDSLEEIKDAVHKLPGHEEVVQLVEHKENEVAATTARRIFWMLFTFGGTAVGGWLLHLIGISKDSG